MRVRLGQLQELTRERVPFIKQFGIQDVVLSCPPLPGEAHWEFRDLIQLRMTCEDAGLRLAATENIPRSFYNEIMVGLHGRDAKIEHVVTTIRNICGHTSPSLDAQRCVENV